MFDTTFRRVRTLQPDVDDNYFDDDPEPVSDQQVLNDLRLAITCWEPPRNQFSVFFLDEFTIDNAVRQIVTAVLVKTQKVRCKIVHKAIPYDGSILFDRPLPSNLRELEEAKVTLNFPMAAIEDEKQLTAGEFLTICNCCNGSGSFECPKCSGAGTKACRSCGGAGFKACRTCNGAGEVLETATTTRRCATCDGAGTQSCDSCLGRGVHACNAAGCINGSLECVSCLSSGKLRNATFLQIETFVKVGHHLHCKNGWIDPSSELATDLMVLRAGTVIDDAGEVTSERLRRLLPENLRQEATRTSRSLAEMETDDSWDLGSRYELRAGYVYHVIANHLNKPSELIVSGCSNSVTVLQPPEQPRSLFKKLGRGIGSLLSGDQVTNSDHVEAVRAGKAFLSDFSLIGPALREQGLLVSLNPDGYDVEVPDAPEGLNRVMLHFNFDPAGQIILHCSILLGAADRDFFPEALMLCNQLPVGQIALQELDGGGVERFFLVNRQSYATTSAPHLAHLLRRMLSTALGIRKTKRIGLSL